MRAVSVRWFTLAALASLAFAAVGGASCEAGSPADEGSGGFVPAPGALCRVYEGLSAACWSCHGETLHANAPERLVTRADLMAESLLHPGETEAERALVRLKLDGAPMPPGKNAGDKSELSDALSRWIRAGYPDEACGDVALDPYATATVCSGKQLEPDQEEGDEMNPGRPCNACHEQENAEEGGDAPIFAIAGTVFPNAHERDDCDAKVDGGTVVEIVDANGTFVSLDVNDAGNFFYEEHDLVPPYTARVVNGARVRAMAAPLKEGSCNECHSVDGDEDAPGRILAP